MPRFSSSLAERGDLRPRRAALDLAVGEHALLDFEAQRALDQRLVLLEEQIVGVRPVDAADLVDVAEALVMSERGLAPVRSRIVLMAIVEPCRKSSRRESIAGFALATPELMPSTRLSGVESALPKVSRPVFSSNSGDIGECAADIGGEPQLGRFIKRHCASPLERMRPLKYPGTVAISRERPL